MFSCLSGPMIVRMFLYSHVTFIWPLDGCDRNYDMSPLDLFFIDLFYFDSIDKI